MKGSSNLEPIRNHQSQSTNDQAMDPLYLSALCCKYKLNRIPNYFTATAILEKIIYELQERDIVHGYIFDYDFGHKCYFSLRLQADIISAILKFSGKTKIYTNLSDQDFDSDDDFPIDPNHLYQ